LTSPPRSICGSPQVPLLTVTRKQRSAVFLLVDVVEHERHRLLAAVVLLRLLDHQRGQGVIQLDIAGKRVQNQSHDQNLSMYVMRSSLTIVLNVTKLGNT
jgi:hypothetical protein